MRHGPAMGAAVDITRNLGWLLLLTGIGLLLYKLFVGATWFWALTFILIGIVVRIISSVLRGILYSDAPIKQR